MSNTYTYDPIHNPEVDGMSANALLLEQVLSAQIVACTDALRQMLGGRGA